MVDTDKPALPEQLERWCHEREAEKASCDQAGSVAAIAEMAGIPKWKVYKVAAQELEQAVRDALGKNQKNDDLINVITESICYSCELTREDGWHTVWPARRLSDLKQFLRDYKG